MPTKTVKPATKVKAAAKRTPRTGGRTVYDIVTDRILADLDKGVVPWRKPWTGMSAPRNAATGRAYRGINVWLLISTDRKDQRWMTYNQAAALDAQVRKGEKGEMVIFWTSRDRDATAEEIAAGHPDKHKSFVLRYYTVFNVEQLDNLDESKLKAAGPATAIGDEFNPIEAAEAVVTEYTHRAGAPGFHIDGDAAYYAPKIDSITVPPAQTFESADAYYTTVYHEFAHSTGHATRLKRATVENNSPFGSANYGKEELIAEWGAAFVAAHTGIDTSRAAQSAAYIGHWMKAIHEDRKMVVMAASQGQNAAEYILGTKAAAKAEDEDGEDA